MPYTWDIFHEKWGWMLIFWNIAGVPFLYCANSFFIAERDVALSRGTTSSLLLVLLAGTIPSNQLRVFSVSLMYIG